MGCTGCSVATENGTPTGCGSKGNCSTGGCNRLNTFDWLSQMEIADVDGFDIVEISFKNGARKAFYHTDPYARIVTGDMAVVEAPNGYDIGRVSLSGELVRLQMKKRKVREDQVLHGVIRRANERDLERLQEAREQEHHTLVRARAIARSLKLDMKMGDVEYQGDKRKATFYYTANGRVDFRELIRHYAREFRIKVEMRQIGARQESARIGGLGSCGRELCCSTWLTDFKSVSTAAARYQNLAINQAKLSGQCGRLKCCLNYELDTYMEAIKAFPDKADKLQTEAGIAVLVKTDIFQQIMYYCYQDAKNRSGKLYALEIEQVKKVQAMNKKGEKPLDLGTLVIFEETVEDEPDFEDINNILELPPEERKKKKKKRRKKKPSVDGQAPEQARSPATRPNDKQQEDQRPGQKSNANRRDRSNRRRRPNKNQGNQGDNQGGQPRTPEQKSNEPRNRPDQPGQEKSEGGNPSSGRRRNRGRGRGKKNNKGGGGPSKDSDS